MTRWEVELALEVVKPESEERAEGEARAATSGPRKCRKAKAPVLVPCVHKKYGPARYGLQAEVVPGMSITLVGTLPAGSIYERHPETGRYTENNPERPIRRSFKIGDEAECHSYNLVYTGEITSITTKTVTIVEYKGTGNEKVYRLSLYGFAEKNWDFDAAEAHKRNSEWSD